MEWNQWCRLCGKEDGNQINIFIKNENLFNIVDTVQRFFSIEIINTEQSSKYVCILCNEYLLSLINYADKIAKTQQLFMEIESNLKVGTEIDAKDLRLKYNFPVLSNYKTTFFINKLDNAESENYQENKTQVFENIENNSVVISNSKIFVKRKKIEQNNILDTDSENFTEVNNFKKNYSDKSKQITIQTSILNSEDEDTTDFDIDLNDNSSEKSSTNDNDNNLENVSSESEKTNKVRRKKQCLENKKRIYKTGEKNFECQECHQKFTRESNYLYHVKKSHKGLPPCEFCGKICKTKQKLRLHLELHLPPEEREKLLYKCPHCDKKFTQSAKVKEHVRAIHLQEKPFVCEQCGKNFASQSNLCSHKRTHDNQSRLNCSLCPKIFNNPHKLRFHIKHTHNSTGHPCSVCGQVLKTRKTLRNHMLIHSDVKPFKCNYCGKDFKRDKNLQIHMITHSGLKPFACRFCTQSYANRSNCKKHEKHSHPSEYEAAAAIIDNEPQQLIQKKLPNIAQLETMLEQLKAEREYTTVNSSSF